MTVDQEFLLPVFVLFILLYMYIGVFMNCVSATIIFPTIYSQVCVNSSTVAGDTIDNDCDSLIDEETLNGIGKHVHSSCLQNLQY